MMSALSRGKTIKLPFCYHERVRNFVIAGFISSQNSIAFARIFGGVSARRESTIAYFHFLSQVAGAAIFNNWVVLGRV